MLFFICVVECNVAATPLNKTTKWIGYHSVRGQRRLLEEGEKVLKGLQISARASGTHFTLPKGTGAL
jgi:hypothetical protein